VACAQGSTCSTSELCCFTPATLLTPSAYSCSSKPCTGADVAVACDGTEDCTGTEECCRVDSLLLGGPPSYSCRNGCTSTVIKCGGPDNCPHGQVCCETVPPLGAATTACVASCTGLGLYRLCRTNADCATGTCVDSTTLPGFRNCQ
jgi:hypothetical protein